VRRLTLPALIVSLTPLLMLAVPALGGNSGNSAENSVEAQYTKGARSYRKRCARCHGVNMVNPASGIFDLRAFPKDDKERFADSVLNGKNAMPSWGDVLQDDHIDDLWIYVTTHPAQ
jgi:LSD1 subclass zinc finger protein